MSNKLNWQQRQAELKKAAILELLDAVTSKESLEQAAARISEKYDGKRLPQGKRLRLSDTTLKRLWRTWKKNPSDSVFDLNYEDGPQTQLQPWVSELIVNYAILHGLNIPQTHKRLKASVKNLPFSERTLRRHLSDADQSRIARNYKLIKQQTRIFDELDSLKEGN